MSEREILKPRPYQDYLIQVCVEKNTVVYLPTGAGKTFIPLKVFERFSKDFDLPLNRGGKRSIFLASTKVLAKQQYEYFKEKTPFKVAVFTGDMNVDFWTGQKWRKEFDEFHIIVATYQIILDVVRHKYLDLRNMNVIVFDECHNASGEHPISQFMQQFVGKNNEYLPRIIGLTGMILTTDRLETVAQDLANFEVLMRSTIATVATIEDYANVLVYSTKANEKIVQFSKNVPTIQLNAIKRIVDKVMEEIEKFHFDPEAKRMSDNEDVSKSSAKKKLLNYWKDFLYQAEDFGVYGASLAILGLIVELDLKRRSASTNNLRIIYRSSIKHAEMIRRILVNFMENSDIPVHEVIMKNSTEKLKTFLGGLETLLEMFKNEKLNCLVFVERRFTAKCLYHILKTYAESKENYAIRPDYMVGDDNHFHPELEIMLQNRWNRQIIKKFKTNEVNLIVCTSVLEEGVDLQSCNIVINYDTPRNFRSYVQRKGRARASTSIFMLMTEQSEQAKILNNITKYRAVEEKMKSLLIGKCVDRELPSNEEIDREISKDAVKFYSKNGAVLEETSAIPLLNRYCSCLPGDNFTINTVDITEDRIKGQFRVKLNLPTQSTIKETVYGDPKPNKKLAKRSAAFNACIKLYESGELNENLLPIDKLTNLVNVQKVYFQHWKNYKKGSNELDGTKKMKRYCQVEYPKELVKCQPEEGKPCFLYTIHTTSQLNASSNNVVDDNIDIFNQLLQEKRGFGILTTKKLPKLAPMNFFMTDGEVSVKIEKDPVKNIKLTADQLLLLRKFHIVIFDNILKTRKNFMTMDYSNIHNSILIVPILGKKIDMDLVRDFQEMPPVAMPTDTQRFMMTFRPEDYLYRVISPWYRVETSQRYVVTKIHHNLSPNSAFPNEAQAKTYAEYFKNKYQVNTVNLDQFLIEVKGISNNLNLLNPGMGEKGGKSRSYRLTCEILIPELCHNFNFPASMWLKARILPNVLHRLHFMLHADDLRLKIDKYLGVRSTNKFDALRIDPNNFKVPEEVEPKRSIFGPHSDEVIQVEKGMETMGDIVELLFEEHEPPVDIHRHWNTIYPIDLEYYYKFINLSDDFENKMIRDIFNGVDNEVNSSAMAAICGPTYKDSFHIKIIKMDLVNPNIEGPQQRDVLCSLTAASAHDVFDMERYEVLGDAFLKFTTSLYLLQKHSTWHEGFLTSCKGQFVGNRNLFYCGSDIGIPGIINVSPFCVSDFIVPHMGVPQEVAEIVKDLNLVPNTIMRLECSDWEVINGRIDLSNNQELLEHFAKEDKAAKGTVYPINIHLGKHHVSDKTVSDTIEAILGVWIEAVGIRKSFKLLNFFNILPNDVDMENLLANQKMEPRISPKVTNADIDSLLIRYMDIEKKLSYEFKDRAYLLQALTHPSYPTNRITGCYQKLEFLGDAVLDIIITSYIFEHCTDMDPGKMTDLRSALVNNITLACICVRNKFHMHMLTQNSGLTESIMNFARYQQQNRHKITEHVLLLNEEDGEILADSVDVPKILGDTMEALLGAVFLDSGNDLSTVWRVIVHLMGNEILEFTNDVPINAVRQLFEWPCANPEFSQPVLSPEKDTTKVSVRFVCRNKYMETHGFGTNKANAKKAAAKAALQYLRKNR